MYGYYIEVHVQRRKNNIQNTASECFPCTWSSSLQGVLDLYRTLGCYPGPWYSSLRGVFDLYLTLGCFTGSQHNNYINPDTFFVFEIWKLYRFIYFSVECSIQHYVKKFVSDAVVFSGFLHQKNWQTGYTMQLKYCWKWR